MPSAPPIIRPLTDAQDRRAALPALARLRLSVFRDWPYLYEGTEAYEARYLEEYMAEPGSVLVTAQVDGVIVGAATASPLSGQKADFQAPFLASGLDIGRLFYFGESVLLPAFRGLGIGHGFFDAREEAARQAGASHACFCAVIREADHPLRPENARDLHPFWQARGYAPLEGAVTTFAWKDVDQAEETAHPMQFWMRAL
ncbi:MAG: N-acetyltransferase family protein [Sphingobium sp.]